MFLYCLGTQDGAIEYVQRHRNIPPGMYNERRMRERPIPDDEAEIEDSIEEILTPRDFRNDGSPNTTLNASSNPLNTSSEANEDADDVSGFSNEHSNLGNGFEDETRDEIEANITSVTNEVNDSRSFENQIATANLDIESSSNALYVTTNNDLCDEIVADGAANNDSQHQEQLVDEINVLQELAGGGSISVHVSMVGNAEEIVPNRAIEDNSSQERSFIQNTQQSTAVIDPVLVSPSNDDARSHNISNDNDALLPEPSESENEVDSNDQIDVKPNVVPLYQIYRTNNNDILNQLEDWVIDYVDDEIEIAISSKGYAAPLNTTEEGLVKHEKPNEFSGLIPCLNTVSH